MDCVAAWIGNCAGMGDLAIKTTLLLCPTIDPTCIWISIRDFWTPIIERIPAFEEIGSIVGKG